MSVRRSYGDPCGVARGLDVIGERWALLIVRNLLLGPKRFNDLLAGLSGLSPNVLSQRLRDLADHEVVRRRDLGAPARVHLYELTERGRALEPILLQLGRWGSQDPIPVKGELGIDSLLLSIKAGFDPANAVGLRGLYEIRVDADNYFAEVSDGGLEVRQGTGGRPDATLITDIVTFRAVCNRQRTLADARKTGDLKLDGDRQAVKRLTALIHPAAKYQGG